MGAVLLLSLLGQRTWQSNLTEEGFESQFEYSWSRRKMCGRVHDDSWDSSHLEGQEVEKRDFSHSAGFVLFPIFLVHWLSDGTAYTWVGLLCLVNPLQKFSQCPIQRSNFYMILNIVKLAIQIFWALLFDKGPHNRVCYLEIHYGAKDELELLVFLPPTLNCWYFRIALCWPSIED